nr:ORF EF1 [Invertebrate iridescent virus 6]
MKSKKELMDALNKLVITEICSIFPDIQRVWEDQEFQKKFASTIGVKPKDVTNVPKRNKSSYLFFCQEIRPSIVAEMPDIKPNQVMVHLGKKWSELPLEDRKKYDVMAVEDRKRYLASKEANKKLNKPVKISGYLQFCADERKIKLKFPDLTTKDITAKLGGMWNDYKKNNPQYLKSKYGYEIVEQHYDYEKNEIDKENIIPSSHRRKMVPSIPVLVFVLAM